MRQFREARGAELGEPVERISNLGEARPHDALAIVTAARLEEGAHCDLRGISCQFRGLEDGCGGHVDARVDHDEPALRELDRVRVLCPGLPPKLMNRRRKPGRRSRGSGRWRRAESGSGGVDQRWFKAGRVVAASELPPPRPPPIRDAFGHAQVTRRAGCRWRPSAPARPDDEVGLRWHVGWAGGAFDDAVVADWRWRCRRGGR